MGCFSFMCKKCEKPILSNSFSGQEVKLYLLQEGKVIQDMEGQYDSYGRVFNGDCSDSIYWELPWSDVCDLMFSNNKGNGIAAVHTKCLKGNTPNIRSDDDPNQGWGEDLELLTNTDIDLEHEKED